MGKFSYIINSKRIEDNIRMIPPVLLNGQKYPCQRHTFGENRRASDLLRRARADTLRCKNKGPPRLITINIDSTGEFLHPSHARPLEQSPPAQIKGRGVILFKHDLSYDVIYVSL